MKYSKQREMIFRAVQSMKTHPTAGEIYTVLRAKHPNISLGTVYRNLNVLSEMGKIKKIRISSGSDRFDFRVDDHYHMICQACGEVIDIEIPELDPVLKRLESEGFDITELNLNLRGICNKCRRKKEEAI